MYFVYFTYLTFSLSCFTSLILTSASSNAVHTSFNIAFKTFGVQKKNQKNCFTIHRLTRPLLGENKNTKVYLWYNHGFHKLNAHSSIIKLTVTKKSVHLLLPKYNIIWKGRVLNCNNCTLYSTNTKPFLLRYGQQLMWQQHSLNSPLGTP